MRGKKNLSDDIKNYADSQFRDLEIERQVISYLIRINPVLSVSIRSDWFSDSVLQDVFIVVSDLRITMSPAMILNELSERNLMLSNESEIYEETLDRVMEIDVSGYNDKNVKHMIIQILRLSESRRVLRGCAEVVTSMRNFDLEAAQTLLADLGKSRTLLDDKTSGYYLDDYESRMDILESRENRVDSQECTYTGIPTGVYRFDKLTGGMLPGEFGFIMGVTGVGKTAALLEFGCNAWEAGHNVMLVSGEMSKEELQFRIDSRLTRINGIKFRNAELTDEDKQKWKSTILEYRAKYSNRLFIASYPRSFTIGDVEADMLRVEEETGCSIQLICLDYINIVSPMKSRGSKSGWQDQSDSVWDFKGLCSEYKKVGWTAGQVKDEAYDKELYDPSDAKYARAISEAAYCMIGLIRTRQDLLEKRMKFQVVKMRNASGNLKPIALTPNLGIMRLHEEIREGTKTLAEMKPHVDVSVKKAYKPRRRSLHGR